MSSYGRSIRVSLPKRRFYRIYYDDEFAYTVTVKVTRLADYILRGGPTSRGPLAREQLRDAQPEPELITDAGVLLPGLTEYAQYEAEAMRHHLAEQLLSEDESSEQTLPVRRSERVPEIIRERAGPPTLEERIHSREQREQHAALFEAENLRQQTERSLPPQRDLRLESNPALAFFEVASPLENGEVGGTQVSADDKESANLMAATAEAYLKGCAILERWTKDNQVILASLGCLIALLYAAYYIPWILLIVLVIVLTAAPLEACQAAYAISTSLVIFLANFGLLLWTLTVVPAGIVLRNALWMTSFTYLPYTVVTILVIAESELGVKV